MDTKTMSRATILSLLADLLGILGFIMLVKKEIDGAIKSLDLPVEMGFYFLFFWAVLAAFLGGVLWTVLCCLNERYPFMPHSAPLGGTESEPHGSAAVVWALASGVPVVAVPVILNWKYHFTGVRQQMLLYLWFLVGTAVGSVLFCDLRLAGNRGFRIHLEAKKVPFLQREFLLVVIWSALLSILGFLPVALAKAMIGVTPRDWGAIVWPLLKQVGLCIGLTTLAVAFFILILPDHRKFDAARGIVAGLVLRATLFFGLLVG